MKSSDTQKRQVPPVTKARPPKGAGGGYQLGPRREKTVPAGAVWMSAKHVCDRYGGKSHMWLYRNIKNNPAFPKPSYQGRMQIFSVAEFDEYDRRLISEKIGGV
jgi:predicted DNA-binding transcriptional regulator AlpA